MKQFLRWFGILSITLFLSGCGLFGGKEESPAAVEETPSTEVVVEIPTATPLPPTPQPAGMVSLTGGNEEIQSETVTNDETGNVSLPRFYAGEFSFVPPEGWGVQEFDGQDVWIVYRAGDSTLAYNGDKTDVPFVYLRLVTDEKVLTTQNRIEMMHEVIAGVLQDETPAAPILDGVRGVGQFVEGRNNTVVFRSYLMAVPTGNKMLEAVFWGPKDNWALNAPQMASVLETIRLQVEN